MHKSGVMKVVEQIIEKQADIDTILDNLNSLVVKYYKEELKDECEAFRFRIQHLNVPSLWPANEKTLNFYLNIKPGPFMSKIDEILREEHLLEIGRKIRYQTSKVNHPTRFKPKYPIIPKTTTFYKDMVTSDNIRISYHNKFFCNHLIQKICENCVVIQRACILLLKIVKDNDMDAQLWDKGWLLMFFSFLIYRGHIPTVINDGSTSSEKLYEALGNFTLRFDEELKPILQKKYLNQEYKLVDVRTPIDQFRNSRTSW